MQSENFIVTNITKSDGDLKKWNIERIINDTHQIIATLSLTKDKCLITGWRIGGYYNNKNVQNLIENINKEIRRMKIC